MLQWFVLAQAITAEPTVEVLKALTEILVAYGVYALVVIFLFYQQGRTFKAFKEAPPADRDRLWKVYRGTVRFTYVLIAIMIPVWILATFFYRPKTVLLGDVSNLKQMAGSPQQPGTVFVDQQIAPLQADVKFYVDTRPDRSDPSKVTFNFALVEDGSYDVVPLVFSHRYKELVPATAEVPLDPNQPAQAAIRDITQKKIFKVKIDSFAVLRGRYFDYRYIIAAGDPDHKIGAIKLLKDGGDQEVPLEDLQTAIPAGGHNKGILAWLSPSIVFAQNAAVQHIKAADTERVLPYLGSRDLKQQLVAEKVLSNADSLSWNSVRAILADPKATEDHVLFVHNLSELVTAEQQKGMSVPPDIRLNLAKSAYKVSDFKTATPLFNSLSESDFKTDVNTYYYRGVSNIQMGNFDAASNDLSKYVSKAPNQAAKAVGQKTLSVANEKSKAK